MDPRSHEYFSGGGRMGDLMRSVDWANTPLGPVDAWPRSLKTALRIVLCSRHPMFVWWGRDLINLYNDAYAPMLGKRHPWALGKPAKEVWHEIWGTIGPQTEAVLTRGQANWAERVLLVMQRNGFTEETYFTYAYTPVPDDEGRVGGVFNTCSEDTGLVVGERRLRLLGEINSRAQGARSVAATAALVAGALGTDPHDLPFALLYLFDPGTRRARLAGFTGLDPSPGDRVIDLGAKEEKATWPLGRVLSGEKRHVMEDLAPFGALPGGPWPESPRRAVVMAIEAPNRVHPAAFLVCGVSPRRPLDAGYLGFFDLVAGGIGSLLASARSYEEQRERAEELAALDKAKTAFFSNVSHEFRTPLTLMLAPLEESLTQRVPLETEQTALVHRNGLRLLRLVNSLLDFARIEAGRAQASREPLDLATLTTDLASAFRPLIEKAGMRLLVETPALAAPVFVDREMWEKIVLNLLSNAFKFTFEGEIGVALRETAEAVVLSVRDTGIGIPADEIPHVFGRFHRVEGASGRTYEGTGIGLALVQELVKLHDGEVHLESVLGKGTTFTITIPKGNVPEDGSPVSAPASAVRADAYVEEALRWLPDEGSQVDPATGSLVVTGTARVLLADDNADMRDHVRRLLSPRYEVETVNDGAAALAAIERNAPSLVLADVMMPRLDGFGLVKKLRADPRTRTLPIILLSARAGEEARVEGLDAGADDYLVKPFGARELLARVRAHLGLATMRCEIARHKAVEAELREALRARDEFVSIAAHELRTPLTPLQLRAQGLRQSAEKTPEKPLSEVAVKIRGIEEHVGHLTTLVDRLLDFSSLSERRIQLHPDEVDLVESLQVVARRMREQLETVRCKLTVTSPRSLVGYWDPLRLEQVVTNLLSNAVKYGAGKPIEIDVEEKDGCARLSVIDHGIGIERESQGRIFDRFQRAVPATSYGGFGLGLWVCRQLVEAMGGTIDVDSKTGEGAAFRVTLPVRGPEARAKGALESLGSGGGGEDDDACDR